ncbi:helix-turn-helix protein [Volucribacter psittacicida]|uniref:Helix-turn-helix protein n=2 Tax=Volucribacter psittacicida TaxID=203482 RepID=A0A4R1GC04_9PAST|nr:helix-turn-helix protein [Volucribacter psittacicida]
MTIKDFSKVTNIPYRSLQSYMRMERELSIDAAIKIANKLSVNLNWLLLGINERYLSNLNELSLSPDEIELLDLYRSTNDLGKRILQATSKTILDELK